MFCSMKLISCLLSLYPIVPLICLLLIDSPQNLTFVLLFNYTLFPHLTLVLILALIAIHSLLPSQHSMFLYLHLVKLFPPHLDLLFPSLPHLSHLFHHNLSLSPFHQSFHLYLYLILLPQFHMWLLQFRFLPLLIPILWWQGLRMAFTSLKQCLLRLHLVQLRFLSLITLSLNHPPLKLLFNTQSGVRLWMRSLLPLKDRLHGL